MNKKLFAFTLLCIVQMGNAHYNPTLQTKVGMCMNLLGKATFKGVIATVCITPIVLMGVQNAAPVNAMILGVLGFEEGSKFYNDLISSADSKKSVKRLNKLQQEIIHNPFI